MILKIAQFPKRKCNHLRALAIVGFGDKIALFFGNLGLNGGFKNGLCQHMPKRKKSFNDNKQALHAQSGTFIISLLRLRVLAGVAIIVLVAFLVYLPSICGEFVYDDHSLLTQNNLIQTFDGLHKIWCTTEPEDCWPVTYTALWVEWRLWAMYPTGYHVANLILHIVEAMLIWVILRKLSIPGAFLAAIIFTVHPVNVESVAWISQQKNMMAMCFFLLSILWYINAAIPTASTDMASVHSRGGLWEPATSPWPMARSLLLLWYWLSLGAFVLAMLSKGSAAVLPVLLLGIVWWRRRLTRWDFLRTAPFFIVAVALTLVNISFQKRDVGECIRDAGFLERILGAGAVVCFYLYKAILPLKLIFIYPQWNIQTGNFLWWLPLLAALIVTAVLWWFRKGWSRPLLFAWGFFCVSLLPVMGFTDVSFMKYSLVADHYQHIAIIGVIALASAGWSIWHQRARNRAYQVSTAVAVVATGTLAFLTWQQSGIYHNAIELYQATLQHNPGCWVAQNNLGSEFDQKGRLQEAIEHYRQALRLNPDYPNAHNNLGAALANAGRLQEAIEHYEQALRLDPDYPNAHNNLGAALANAGRLQEAIEHYEQALRLKPDFATVHNNLGLALANAGLLQEAIEHYQLALRLKPDFTNVYCNLAFAYARMRQSSEAIGAAQKGLELARSQGQMVQAKQIEDWLNAYRVNLSNFPNVSPSGGSNRPAH
jgi:tetratricopeptide (TPR) repeat protein